MTKSEKELAKHKIEKLRAEIEKHRIAYHVHDTQTVSDAVYDSLMKELSKLEEENPEFDDELSPTKRIGGELLSEFKKFKHKIPQWSFDNVFNFEELKKWEERNLNILKKKNISEAPNYFAELKIDGLKIVLYYVNGRLENAVTRGDGETGEDVAENIKTIKTIPLVLSEDISMVVIGELWMGKAEFERINLEREKVGLEVYKNPRNTAAGTVRQLDPKIVSTRKLEFFAYNIFADDKSISTQKEEIETLGKLGFMVNRESVYCNDLNDVEKVYKKWNSERRNVQEYGIDGLVVKINQKNIFNVLGYTAKSPRGGIAYKFFAEEAVATLLSVTYQVGRTGVVTPVAELTPVELGGSTVKRATLHNFDEIERLGVMIGDKVSLKKAGDIIPQIIQVFKELRTGDEKIINRIKKCPACVSTLVVDTEAGGVKLVCKNEDCEAKRINKIIYFASRKCANIENLGESTVEILYKSKFIKNISDIYKLEKSQILSLEGFKEKSANNLLESIGKARVLNLSTFIMGLSINNVGEETSEDLAKHFKSLNNFLKLDRQELEKIYGIGEKTVTGIIDFFGDNQSVRQIDELLQQVKVKDYVNLNNSSKLDGLRFVITGSFEASTRPEIEKLIKQNGGEIQSTVNSKTSYLILGEDAGSKLEKANKLGTKKISLDEFLKLL